MNKKKENVCKKCGNETGPRQEHIDMKTSQTDEQIAEHAKAGLFSMKSRRYFMKMIQPDLCPLCEYCS